MRATTPITATLAAATLCFVTACAGAPPSGSSTAAAPVQADTRQSATSGPIRLTEFWR